MTYWLTAFLTLALALYIFRGEDDDDQGGGTLIPAYGPVRE